MNQSEYMSINVLCNDLKYLQKYEEITFGKYNVLYLFYFFTIFVSNI